MITKELMETALKSGHEGCRKSGCIHAEALSENMPTVEIVIEGAASAGVLDPLSALFFEGLHVGYRLAQLEATAPVDKKTVD